MKSPQNFHRIQILDTHTGGEPTRVIVAGGPDLGSGSMVERRSIFQQNFDEIRRGVACEPRGSDVMVGAILTPPVTPGCVAGVIFFNNIGYLNMCGHGTIGVAVALEELGRIKTGVHRLDTPVGIVSFENLGQGEVRIENVPSYRSTKKLAVELADGSTVHGDIAWGGNWFFLCDDHGEKLHPKNVESLTLKSWAIRRALESKGIGGLDGPIDHIELMGPSDSPHCHAKNFVLCPGGAYDRSPCGTGTSAKVACLAADGKLNPGEAWVQESIIGSRFVATYRWEGDRVIPTISGNAYISGEATLRFEPHDPFCWGIGT